MTAWKIDVKEVPNVDGMVAEIETLANLWASDQWKPPHDIPTLIYVTQVAFWGLVEAVLLDEPEAVRQQARKVALYMIELTNTLGDTK